MELLNCIYQAMEKKLAENIVVIDFQEESSFCDYFVIGTAKNNRMARSIVEGVEEEVLKNGGTIRSIEGDQESPWQLIDCYRVIVHVFVGEERELYRLEKLWADLPRIEVKG